MAELRELTVSEKLRYSSAHFGLSAVTQAQLLLFLFFYSSDEGPGPFTSRKLIGYAMLFGRIVDAVSDPLVGNWSDRTQTRWGRRLPFFVGGMLPLCAVFVFTWTPPVGRLSWVNALYAAVLFGAFNLLYTVVICPYLALMPDIARTASDRVSTMAYMSVFNVAGVAAGMIVPFVLAPRLGYVAMAVILSAVLFGFAVPTMFGPRERVTPQPSGLGFFEAVRMTLGNRHFAYYLLAFSLQWMGLCIVLATIPDYVTRVLGQPLERAAVVMLATLAGATVMFPLVPRMAALAGRRAVFRWGCLSLGVLVPWLALIGHWLPGSPMAQMTVLMVLAGIPTAMLFVVPYTLLADVIEYDAQRCGVRREAMYFGVQGLIVKISWGIAGFIAAQLLEYLGPSDRAPGELGLRIAGPVAASFFLAAFFAVKRYTLGERPAWPDTSKDRCGTEEDAEA